MLIRDIVTRNAEQTPDADALVMPGRPAMSWGTLEQRANRLARALLGLGLERGDRLAILAPNCPEYIEFFFACAKTGIIGAPVNVRQTADELAAYLRYVEPRAILVHADVGTLGEAVAAGVPSVAHRIGFSQAHGQPLELEGLLAAQEPEDPGCEVPGDAVYQLCPTSGTTGLVKGAMITQENAIASIMGWLTEFPTNEGDTQLQSLSLFFNSGGPASGMPPAFLKGGRMVLIPGFEPLAVLRSIQEYGVYQTTLVPTMVRMLLDHPERPNFDLSSLRAIVVGGAPVSAALVEEVRAAIGPVVYPFYAMAETNSSGLILRQEHLPLTAGRTLLPTGRPQTNMSVRVVGDDGDDVPGDGETTGEVWLRGRPVSVGYFRLESESAACRSGEWLKTGDVAVVDENRLLTLVDRAKDIIITGGINVVSREVEEAVAAHPGVTDAAVIGVPHERWGEAIHAVVVRAEDEELSEDELIAFVAERIATYKRPQSVEFVAELPRTATGKVLKRELRQRRTARA